MFPTVASHAHRPYTMSIEQTSRTAKWYVRMSCLASCPAAMRSECQLSTIQLGHKMHPRTGSVRLRSNNNDNGRRWAYHGSTRGPATTVARTCYECVVFQCSGVSSILFMFALSKWARKHKQVRNHGKKCFGTDKTAPGHHRLVESREILNTYS